MPRAAESVPIPNTKCALLHLSGCNFLLLDVSYRDDLRQCFAWKSSSGVGPEFVQSWAWTQWRSRFQVGTMSLEEADAGIFTGLQVVWDGAQISLQPRCMRHRKEDGLHIRGRHLSGVDEEVLLGEDGV